MNQLWTPGYVMWQTFQQILGWLPWFMSTPFHYAAFIDTYFKPQSARTQYPRTLVVLTFSSNVPARLNRFNISSANWLVNILNLHFFENPFVMAVSFPTTEKKKRELHQIYKGRSHTFLTISFIPDIQHMASSTRCKHSDREAWPIKWDLSSRVPVIVQHVGSTVYSLLLQQPKKLQS